jgi:hypothetical protein
MNIEKRSPGRPRAALAAHHDANAVRGIDDDRLAERIRQIRGTATELGDSRDKFWAPAPPPGWDYQWKMFTVMGKEYPERRREQIEQGWTPVPLSRHPEMMPPGWSGETIELEGQVLMERPMIFTEEARARESREARSNVRSKEEQLGLSKPGQFDRNPSRVKKGYEPIPVGDDE